MSDVMVYQYFNTMKNHKNINIISCSEACSARPD